MNKVIEGIKNHIDFRLYPVTWISIIVAFLVIPCIKFLPEQYGYENGLLENIQMVFLVISMFLAFMTKTNKKFFRFVGLVIILLILREINYGRTIFFPIPDTVNQFYSWKEIKYGWLVNPLVALYMVSSGIYFIINKLYLNLWQIIKNIKFPFWNILLLITGMVLGMYAEKALENMVFEEITEMLFYASLMGIIWLYGFNKNFQTED